MPKPAWPWARARTNGGMGFWEWPRLTAAYRSLVIPPIVSCTIVQRWFMRGLAEGALTR